MHESLVQNRADGLTRNLHLGGRYQIIIFGGFMAAGMHIVTAELPQLIVVGSIILPVVLYGCETWSLTLKEEHRMREFENRVLKRIIFGSKRVVVIRGWRKLHNEELHSLFSSPNTRCLKKSFTVLFQMLLCDECYENIELEGVQTVHRSRYANKERLNTNDVENTWAS
jgi:hypothetical protein